MDAPRRRLFRGRCAGHRLLSPILMLGLLLSVLRSSAGALSFQELKLPALQIEGRPARAHTQGLEILAGQYYLTARRDDVQPKRALLLRTAPGRTDWDSWDITPVDRSQAGAVSAMDHPGGMQSDGTRLWIPVAESRRRGRSVLRVFSPARLQPGKPAAPDVEVAVEDHIGALAVAAGRNEVLGASWDTENVYVWDLAGRRQRQWTAVDLKARLLGIAGGSNGRSGVAVQDWKIDSNRLYASGLFKNPGSTAPPPQSRLLVLEGYWESDFKLRSIVLPRHHGLELAQEAMAISEDHVHFLPQDLGATNRLFRIPLADLLKSAER